jgi:hypothetical protein
VVSDPVVWAPPFWPSGGYVLGVLSVYFVDDNFIGNQKAVLEVLPHLVEWQTRRRCPLRFACEATLNLAKNERVLALMRAAGFITVFCGIETSEPDALHAMSTRTCACPSWMRHGHDRVRGTTRCACATPSRLGSTRARGVRRRWARTDPVAPCRTRPPAADRRLARG